MEAIPYVDELVREYLLFRGLTQSQRTFDGERVASPHLKSYQAEKIVDSLLQHANAHDLPKLEELWNFLDTRFFGRLDSSFADTVRKLKLSVRRYYVVQAMLAGRREKVGEFFETLRDETTRSEDWRHWFALPYMKTPDQDPVFELYFGKQWADTLQLSLHNFISAVFRNIGLPKLLNFNLERLERKTLEADLETLREENLQLRRQITKAEAEKEAIMKVRMQPVRTSVLPTPSSPREREPMSLKTLRHSMGSPIQSALGTSAPLSPRSPMLGTLAHLAAPTTPVVLSPFSLRTLYTLSGPTSSVGNCRISGDGNMVACGAKDATVRIWDVSNSDVAAHNATIFCTGEISALTWEPKSGKFLLFGTTDRNIKLWNVESKRVVCDMFTDVAFPVVADLVCSPADAKFVCAAGSTARKDAGALSVWSLKSCKMEAALPVEPEPIEICCLCFNHNGNMLVAGAADGMIRVYDIITCSPIMAWPAHTGRVNCVKFSHDETTILSGGDDGFVTEWSLYTIRKVVRKFDLGQAVHELVLDGEGLHFAAAFNHANAPKKVVRVPIYHMNKSTPVQTLTNLGLTDAVVSLDWHPNGMMVCGGMDGSIAVNQLARQDAHTLKDDVL